MTPAGLETALRGLVGERALDLPLPGAGNTGARFRALADIAASDLQLGRLVEAHVDAIAILHEVGRIPDPGCLYGVWAAEDPRLASPLCLNRTPVFATLSGAKPFCTGAGIVDRALVTVREGAVAHLVDLDVRSPKLRFDTSTWLTPAFAATNTATSTFDRLEVQPEQIVGAPNWYLNRVGFWVGACAPAACWAGGTVGLVERAFALARYGSANPHRSANLGALDALRWMLLTVIDRAGEEIDAHPNVDAAFVLAHRMRHLVERAATAAIDHIGRALGPRPMIEDPFVVARVAELQVYIRQQHAVQDLAALARKLDTLDGPT